MFSLVAMERVFFMPLHSFSCCASINNSEAPIILTITSFHRFVAIPEPWQGLCFECPRPLHKLGIFGNSASLSPANAFESWYNEPSCNRLVVQCFVRPRWLFRSLFFLFHGCLNINSFLTILCSASSVSIFRTHPFIKHTQERTTPTITL